MTRQTPKLAAVPDPGSSSAADLFKSQWEASLAREAGRNELVRLAFRHHHKMVFASANRILDDRAEAEDVTQGVFETLAKKLDTLRDPAKLPGFLKTCAVRSALAVVKRRRWWKGRRGTLFLQSQQEATNPDAHALASVRQILSALEPEERAAVVLKFVEHHSLDEVAALMETSVSTVRRRLDSARARVAKLDSETSKKMLGAMVVEG